MKSTQAIIMVCMGFLLAFVPMTLTAQDFAYVGNSLSADVSVVDLSTNSVTATIPVGAVPIDIAVSPDTTELAVLCAQGDTIIIPSTPPDTLIGGAIYFVDPVVNGVTSVIPVSGQGGGAIPSDVTYNAAGTALYITYLSQNRVEAFDRQGNSIANIPFSGGPTDLAFRPGTDDLYVLKGSTGEFGIIDAATNTASTTVVLLEGLNGGATSLPISIGITPNGNKAYIANSSDFDGNVVDLATNAVTDIGSGFGGSAFINGAVAIDITPDGSTALVAAEFGNQLLQVSTITDAVTATTFLPFGTNPGGVASTLDNSRAIVPLISTDQVAFVNLSNQTFTTLAVGDGPRDVVVVRVDPCRNVGLTQIGDTICDTDLPFTFGSQILTAAGVFNDTLVTSQGCDSIVELTLVVNPSFVVNQTASICQGDSFLFGSQVLTTGGSFSQSLSTANGCDSVINLVLTVNDTFLVADSAFICLGQSFVFGSQVLDTSGVFVETFASQTGCDSTVVLTLTVGDKVVVNLNGSICEGDSILFDGQFIKAAGMFSDTLVASTGCDSIVNLDLTINPTFDFQVSDTLCDSELPFSFGTQIITTPGVYTETFASSMGCDSTVELSLTVEPTFVVQVADTLCEDELPLIFGSQTINSAGFFSETFSSATGCDSLVELTLMVNAVFSDSVEVEICENELPFQFGSQMLNAAGEFTEVFSSIDGCDSSVALNLVINPIFNLTVLDTVDQNELPIIFGSQTIAVAGTYTETFSSAQGCDSIVTLELEVLTHVGGGLAEGEKFVAYPNPSKGMLRIDLKFAQGQAGRLRVLNELGQEVQPSIELNLTAFEEKSFTFSTEDWSTGVYLLSLELGDRRLVRRLAVLR